MKKKIYKILLFLLLSFLISKNVYADTTSINFFSLAGQYHGNADFENARTGSTGDGSDPSNLTIDASFVGGNYYIRRSPFTVDTTIANATIISATIYVKPSYRYINNGRVVGLFNRTSGNDTIDTSDFSTCGTTLMSDTTYSYSDFGGTSYLPYVLNANGLAQLNLSGKTKFCFRETTKDVGDSAPTEGTQELLQFYGGLTNTGDQPYITINYTTTISTSTPPTISTSTCNMLTTSDISEIVSTAYNYVDGSSTGYTVTKYQVPYLLFKFVLYIVFLAISVPALILFFYKNKK